MGMGWIIVAFVTVFWMAVFGSLASFFDRLSDPYPTAQAFKVLRRHIKKIRSLGPDEYDIDQSFDLKIVVKGRDIVIHGTDVKIAFTEDQAKMLTLQLLTVYPELEDKDFVPTFERLPRDLEHHFKYGGGPVWC